MKQNQFSSKRENLVRRKTTLRFGTMKRLIQHGGFQSLCAAVSLATASVALGQGGVAPLVGIWLADQGYRSVELLFRSDGVYQINTRFYDSPFSLGSTYRGRYVIDGRSLTLTPYEYLHSPVSASSRFAVTGDTLVFTGFYSDLPARYQFQPNSRADVLAREHANGALVRRWTRHILFSGDEEYTFRPGGYYVRTMTHENPVFTEFERGRYELAGNHLTIKPYSGGEPTYHIDVFGSTLTLIGTNSYSGFFTSYEEVPDSYAEVTDNAAAALAFISRSNWHIGVWRMQDQDNTIDLLLRPDGIYSATNRSPVVHRVLRGRYSLADLQIHLVPFVGQERFVLDDDHFGMEEKNYVLDYYENTLQVIEPKPYVQSVLLGQELPGSQAAVLETTRQAQAERARDGWYLGIWEVPTPGDWMEFTFRPDNRYIAKSGAQGVANEVERGEYRVAPGKITLAPYPASGSARGFEFDLYAGDLFLIGNSQRLVVLRKLPGSETGVMSRALDPAALKGERGSILGRWTAHRPSESVELIFRPDGQYRFKRCANNVTSYDYGLYTVDMVTRTLVYDSRFAPVQTRRLDFYGDTMTIYGGLPDTAPSTYTVNLGSVDAAITASLAADAQEAQVDAQWLARVPTAPIDPNAALGDVSADPNPRQIFQGATVFTGFQYYRRLIPRLVFLAPDQIAIVIDTHGWSFFPTGRVMVRFTSGDGADTLEVWGAYEIGPKPAQTDVLHCYADNTLHLLTDTGEELSMTLEDGRRNLFWGKEPQPLGSWALEQTPIACQLSGNPDPSLINTGVSLPTAIPPDLTGEAGPVSIMIAGLAPGAVTVSGVTEFARSLVLEAATSLAPPVHWQPLQSNSVPAGPFSFTIAKGASTVAFFRVRSQ